MSLDSPFGSVSSFSSAECGETGKYLPATFGCGVALAHEEPRTASSNRDHEPTSARSTNYGSDTRTRGTGLSSEAVGLPRASASIRERKGLQCRGHLSSRGASATSRCGLHLAALLSTFNSVDAVCVGDIPGIGQCCDLTAGKSHKRKTWSAQRPCLAR
jgi:hypothetical protein